MSDPLNAGQITDGYSSESFTGSINRAHRNARTLRWLEQQTAQESYNLRVVYALSLGMPHDEVVWLPEPMDDAALEWVYLRCANWINHP